MTLKTVRTHRNITMAGLTELPFGIDRNRLAGLISARMAVDTLGQAVIQPANTIPHGLVSAVFEKVHMIAPHDIRRRNAAVHTGSLGTFGYEGTLCNRLHGREQHPCQQYQKVPVADE
jgi:hypothetical protein